MTQQRLFQSIKYIGPHAAIRLLYDNEVKKANRDSNAPYGLESYQ